MKKLKNNQSGFGAVEIILIIVLAAVIGGIGWYVLKSRNDQSKNATSNITTTSSNPSNEKTDQNSQQALKKVYTIKNEGLSFSYNPKITTVTTKKPTQANGLYVERVEVKTGSVTLFITAGISNIGGGPKCMIGDYDRNKCQVIDTKKSSFLNKPIEYRLIKAETVENCGYEGVPTCDKAPLTTTYFLDTGVSKDTFGDCCGTISVKSKNTGKKAQETGSLLISEIIAKDIQNKELFTNKDLLESIKIIESMNY